MLVVLLVGRADACEITLRLPFVLKSLRTADLVAVAVAIQGRPECARDHSEALQLLVQRPDVDSHAPGLLPQLQVQLLPYLVDTSRFKEASEVAQLARRAMMSRAASSGSMGSDLQRSLLDRAEFHLGESLLRLGRTDEAADVLRLLTTRLWGSTPPGSPDAPALLPMALNNLAVALQEQGKRSEALATSAEAVEAALPHLQVHPALPVEVLRWVDGLLLSAVTLRGEWENGHWPAHLVQRLSAALPAEREGIAALQLVVAVGRHRTTALRTQDLALAQQALTTLSGVPSRSTRADASRRWHAAKAALELGQVEVGFRLKERAVATLMGAADRDPLELASWQAETALAISGAWWAEGSGLPAGVAHLDGPQYARDAAATLDALARQVPPLPADRLDDLFTREAMAGLALCLNVLPQEGIDVLNRAWSRHEDRQIPGLRTMFSAFGLAVCQVALGEPDGAAFWFKLAEEQAYQLLANLPSTTPNRDWVVQRTQEFRSFARELALRAMVLQGRVAEAQLLRQLGAEIDFEVMTRSASGPRSPTPVPLTRAEAQAREELQRALSVRASAAARMQALAERARLHPLTDSEQRELAELTKSDAMPRRDALALAQRRAMALLAAAGAAGQDRRLADAEASRGIRLTPALERLGAGIGERVAGLQILRARDQLLLLLSRPGQAPKVFTVRVNSMQLDTAIDQALIMLQSPDSSPRFYSPVLQRLHAWLFAPVEDELAGEGIRTVLLSLEGSLQLIPFAALLDKRGEPLVKRFRFSHFNEESPELVTPAQRRTRTVAAFGASDFGSSHPPLRHVPGELQAVVQASGQGSRLALGPAFNRTTLTDALRRPAGPGPNVLHLATHFVLNVRQVADSHLVLGDGHRFTLTDFLSPGVDLSNYDLVVFSACDSARLTGAESLQTRSLSAVAQRLGAAAVVGTLWRVDDEASAVFMRAMYRSAAAPPLPSLWAAQEEMARGVLSSQSGLPLTHPFFWAGYVGATR